MSQERVILHSYYTTHVSKIRIEFSLNALENQNSSHI